MTIVPVTPDPAVEPVLEFRGVTRRWRAGILGSAGDAPALDGVSLRVRAGEVVGLTGGAGAGKSTLLLLAAAQAAPSEGEVRWCGRTEPRLARPQLIGARPWEYAFLTVRQALAFHADQLALRSGDLPRPARFVPLMASVGLRGRSRTRLGELGALDRLRVVVAQALLAAPRLLLCEEPFAFCGPREREEGALLLRRVAGRGIGVVVATRDADALVDQRLADRVLRLTRGKLEVDERATRSVLELAVPRPADAFARLAARLPSLARRGRRLRVPLRGQSPEAILALFRDAGVVVRASRVAEERGTLPAPEGDP